MPNKLPQDIYIEQLILGNILNYEKVIDDSVQLNLLPEDFYNSNNQIIYKHILKLYNTNQEINKTNLIGLLTEEKLLDKIGGIPYILTIDNLAISHDNTKALVTKLKEKSNLRKMINLMYNYIDQASNSKIDYLPFLDQVETNLLTITRTTNVGEFINFKEAADKYFDKIVSIKNSPSNITGLKTGFRDIDRLTSGLQQSDLIILAARPSVGKTALSLNLVSKITKLNPTAGIAIFSLEMPFEQLFARLLARETNIPISNIRNGNLNNEDINRINNAKLNLQNKPIYIDDSSLTTVPEMLSKCRKIKKEHGLSLIVIDYIQLIHSTLSNKENRQQEVSAISRSLKGIARELNVPVIALSQLSRNVENRKDSIPMLSDLRESGAIEPDADIVILLSREEYQKENENNIQKTTLNFAKHRNGATDRIELIFEKETNCFKDIVYKDNHE